MTFSADDTFAWVFAGCVVLTLFVLFPRRMLAVMAVVIAIGAAIYLYIDGTSNAEARSRALVTATATVNPTVCSEPGFPINIVFDNRSSRVVDFAAFTLTGRLRDRSTPIRQSTTYTSDIIISPGRRDSACWAIPPLYGLGDASLQASGMVWTVRITNIIWGQA